MCVNPCVALHVYTYKLICNDGTEVPREPRSLHIVANFNASELFQGVEIRPCVISRLINYHQMTPLRSLVSRKRAVSLHKLLDLLSVVLNFIFKTQERNCFSFQKNVY